MPNCDLPLGLRFDERGLIREVDDKIIANFFLEPAKAYRLKGDTLPTFCDIAVIKGGQRIPYLSHVELTKLAPAKWWKTPPPGCFYSQEVRAPHRWMLMLFQELLGKLEPVTIFSPESLGWNTLPTGEHAYVTGSGAVGANGYLPEDRVWIPSIMEKYRLETMSSASEDDAMQYFWLLYRALPGITDILLANAFAAILFPCFKEARVESQFPIILEGPSEAKKTTLACLTGCLYNRENGLCDSKATLTSTNRALEKRGVELRHTLVVYDDLFPDGGSALEQKALDLIRNIANQVPRQSCSGKALEGAAMECGAVITAEAFPNCGRSTRTRCLRLGLSKPIPNGILLPLQEQPELLGNVFQTFIMRVAENFGEVTQQIAEDFRQYRNARSKPGARAVDSERLYEIGFVLYTALKVYLSQQYGPESSITEEELRLFQKQLNPRIEWQLSPQAAPGHGWLVAATAQLARQRPKEFFFRSGDLCIPSKRLCYLLQEICRDKTINLADIIRQLRNEQLLSMDRSGDATRKIKGLGRCLCINEQKLLR